MDELKTLRERQRKLLRAWLIQENGETRFAILQELQTVERELEEVARRERISLRRVQTFSIELAQ